MNEAVKESPYKNTKKTLIAETDKRNPQHVYIRYIGGGEVPEALSGLYTSINDANRAIEAYTSRKANKK